MTNFYVDTEKLKKRNEAGLALREKIEEDPKNPKRIVTVWGKGYRYE